MRKLRTITSLFLFAGFLTVAQAQKPSPKGDWKAVENLNGGAAISVKTNSAHLLCYFERATADVLFCEPWAPGLLRTPPPYPSRYPYPYPSPSLPEEYVFKRETVREVRLEHSQATDQLIGVGIGGAIGAGVGAARFDSARGGGALISGLVGMAIGGAIGRVHPLFHRNVIYRR